MAVGHVDSYSSLGGSSRRLAAQWRGPSAQSVRNETGGSGSPEPPVRTMALLRGNSVAILLDARGAQTGEAVVVDGGLPGKEFLDG